MKKKLLALLLSTVTAISLAACGSAAGTQPAADAKEEAEASAQDKAQSDAQDGTNTLTVWAWDKAFNIYAMEEAAKIYQQERPDFALDIVEVSWQDMQPQLATILSSGDTSQLPDILLMQDFAYQKYILTYDNLFADLTDSGINFDQFSAGKAGASMVDGRNYGVPFDSGTEIAAYRVDLLESAGYTVEDLTDIDWNRFIEIGQDVYAKTGYSLFSSQAGSSDIIMQMVQSAGGSIWNEDGTPFFVGNEILETSMQMYKELFETGVMATANSWDEYIATFTSGKTLGTINGCWIMASVQSAEDQSGLWGITNMPSLPGIATATNYSNQGGSSWGITTNCSNMDLAVDFFSKTFAGSTDLYDTILPSSGALASWIPAGESDVYAQPHEFYGGEAIFKKITEFAANTPAFDTGVYYTEANDALAVAVTNVCTGADIAAELEAAEETVTFNMGGV